MANSRVVRGAVIDIKGNAYFEAAHAIGSPSWRTLLRHVWPSLRGGGGVAGGVGARAAERATKALRKLERSR